MILFKFQYYSFICSVTFNLITLMTLQFFILTFHCSQNSIRTQIKLKLFFFSKFLEMILWQKKELRMPTNFMVNWPSNILSMVVNFGGAFSIKHFTNCRDILQNDYGAKLANWPYYRDNRGKAWLLNGPFCDNFTTLGSTF